MDYGIAHALDSFTAHHDNFEDALSGAMPGAEIVFGGIVIALFLLMPGAHRRVAQRAAVAAGASFAVAAVLAHFVGAAVDRPRPFVAHAATIHAFLAHAPDTSFPSDHATAAFAIATAVALRRRLWGAILLAVAALVAAGRVFLGLHYPSDVVAGALLGAAVAALLFVPSLRRPLDRAADGIGRFVDKPRLR